MNFKNWLLEGEIQRYLPPWHPRQVSRAEAREMVGPVYHGTTADARELIKHQGFTFFKALPRQGKVNHGFEHPLRKNYQNTDSPPPIHFLGFGVYFSTTKGQAAKFNEPNRKGLVLKPTVRGLTAYYLNVPRLEKINFMSPTKKMKWWKSNGFNMPSFHILEPHYTKEEIDELWLKETDKLTKNLSSKYDAVYYLGKGFGDSLDPNQICVYNPESICVIDETSEPELDAGNGVFVKIGDRIQVKGTKATGIITSMHVAEKDPLWPKMRIHSNYFLTLSQTRNFNQVKTFYADKMREILKTDDFLINVRFKNLQAHSPETSFEQCTESYLNHIFQRLPTNFPSGLIDRVLAKGERVS